MGRSSEVDMTELLSIILAAGEGTRMRSGLPKVLHKVGGLPMVGHVVRASQAAGATAISVVVGPNHEAIEATVKSLVPEATIARQIYRLGTGHAVREARAAFAEARGNVVVLYGDGPMLRPETIRNVAAQLDRGADVVVVGFEPDDPLRYGRLLTEGGRLVAIREYADASEAERRIRLSNSGIMGFKAEALRRIIDRIENKNAKGEYYLTDAVELANADGMRVEHTVADANEVLGIDDRPRLAKAEAQFQALRRQDFMEAGVTLHDPATVYFSYDTEIGKDAVIEPNVVFGPGVKIGEGVTIHAFCHIEHAIVGPGTEIGPFARLRGDTVLEEGAKAGTFVEMKNTRVGRGAKVPHLSYMGDAEIGAGSNIGGGTITANYDGLNKSGTTIGANAFIGTNSSLVAPVTVGDGAYVASGSVLTEDVPAEALAFGRARQINKPGYAPKVRARAAAKKAAKQQK
jgi:bifunctional UDP-N-acetylglucosamine pyrophosphorylase/glucosamine-1-phosphate N-acetyltransferase